MLKPLGRTVVLAIQALVVEILDIDGLVWTSVPLPSPSDKFQAEAKQRRNARHFDVSSRNDSEIESLELRLDAIATSGVFLANVNLARIIKIKVLSLFHVRIPRTAKINLKPYPGINPGLQFSCRPFLSNRLYVKLFSDLFSLNSILRTWVARSYFREVGSALMTKLVHSWQRF
jgi:hypothetical protein